MRLCAVVEAMTPLVLTEPPNASANFTGVVQCVVRNAKRLSMCIHVKLQKGQNGWIRLESNSCLHFGQGVTGPREILGICVVQLHGFLFK